MKKIFLILSIMLVLMSIVSACHCSDKQINVVGEQCDDGNLMDGDGCSRSCTIEQGWTCDNEKNTGRNPDSICYEICPLNPEEYDQIIYINQKLVSKELYMDYAFNSPEIPVSLTAGNYSVVLVGRDFYTTRVSTSQPNEQYQLSFIKNGEEVAITPPTSDLQDNVMFAQTIDLVTMDLSLPNGADNVQAIHAMFNQIPTPSQNSLTAVCVGIKKMETPIVPEFGNLAIILTALGAVGIFFVVRRK